MSCDATSFRLECALRDANKHITTIEQKNFEKKLEKKKSNFFFKILF
jgi:hypothetical protein